ncbi:MAG: hypothetical protein AAFX05_11605 [Planctomycetota bacterium]
MSGGLRARSARLLVAVAGGTGLLVSGASASIMPTYSLTFNDATTGDNEFTADGGQRWNVDPGADNYGKDFYERPTAQTYEDRNKPGEGTVAAANEYLGYLDIKQARYGYDSNYMYFQITLYTGVAKLSDGTVLSQVFGSGTEYGVRFSDESENGAGGLYLRINGDSKELWGSTFDSKSGQGYFDSDGSVGGPLGVMTPDEGSGDGFDLTRIESDGGLSGNTTTKVLKGRIDGPVDGVDLDESVMPVVEMAFDYVAYNAMFPDDAIDPSNLKYLVFDADRGLKDNANVLWNDEYDLSEAGTPYDSGNQPQNIYELDTVTGLGIGAVPSPGAGVLAVLAGLMGGRRRR